MNKINQSNIILLMVAVAMIIKGILSHYSFEIFLIAFILILFSISRMFLFKKAMQEDIDYVIKSDDINQKYFKENLVLYIDMLHVYSKEYVDILYEQRDGILLYDSRNQIHYASALNKNAAVEMLEKIMDDYEVLYTYDPIFDTLDIPHKDKDTYKQYVYMSAPFEITCELDISIKQEGNILSCVYQDKVIGKAILEDNKIESIDIDSTYEMYSIDEILLKASMNIILNQDKVPYFQTNKEYSLDYVNITKYTH